ncbi:MAG: lipopolysaccharide heptosyltransferase II [Desulfobulbaceae bacterium]|nr:lipopolysaccharide heptosyltransferase II [Desulfobulbaceae bacterium]
MPSFTLPSQFAGQHLSILVRATNWIGDAIMTLPAVKTIRANFPKAKITVLAQPWVADIFTANPHVDRVILYHKKSSHAGVIGMWRLSQELAAEKFDLAILLQNAFEAALIAKLSRIPVIAGFNRDARRLLLTHPVTISKEIRRKHQVFYYQHLMEELGLTPSENTLHLHLDEADRRWAKEFVDTLPRPIIGLNPGAAYGPAKCWPAERYGEVAHNVLSSCGGSVLVFGTRDDTQAAEKIGQQVGSITDLTGKTTLAKAMALIDLCNTFITNDSGLMHVAAALTTPLVAIFGSTDSVATGPFSNNAIIVKNTLPCSPCLKTHCPTNFECMKGISVTEVENAVLTLLKRGEAGRRLEMEGN